MGKLTKAVFFLFVPMLLFSGLSSCYSDYGMSIKDYDIVVTQYDKDFDFSNKAKKTYVLDDTVRYIDENDKEPERTFDSQILSKIKSELNSLGYVEIVFDSTNLPDFYFTVAITSKDVYSYYWGGGYYPGWGWGGGWGWGYPPYWGGYVGYSYSAGTIITTMVDVENIDDSNPDKIILPAIWSVTINGITNDSNTNISKRIDSNFDQAFQQSPYLQR